MKHLFIALLLILSLSSRGQVVSGLYSGTIYNDTTKMLQQYEVALSEYRGKITGYSYTTFVVNDTFYYGIRTVKATKKDGSLIIEDDKMIVNNFPEISRRVHRISTIPLTEIDTITTLKGRWHTNKTKEYYSVAGSVTAGRNNDSSRSALIGHLQELKLIPGRRAAVQNTGTPKEVVKNKTEPVKQPVKSEGEKRPVSKQPAAAPAVLSYDQRQVKVLETIETASDSLTLSFYDNGVVDGDVISVYINGTQAIEKTLLKEVAVKKTVAVSRTGDLNLLLVAESLGTIPPNTGLLIIHDGRNRYEVKFSADLQTNASIIIRQKK